MNAAQQTLVTILSAVVCVAIVAVLVSRNSQTTGVIQALDSLFSGAIRTAVSPISGSM